MQFVGSLINVLNLRQSGHEMIQFIKKSFDHFTSPKGGKAHGGDGIKKTPKGDHGGEPKVPHKSKPHEAGHKVDKPHESTKGAGNISGKHPHESSKPTKHEPGKDVSKGTSNSTPLKLEDFTKEILETNR
ncbi:hypothetical protein [Bacillus sp. WMMC1349]|uniref:hypothetical protein n=1 Tax=Bacillus sp. WMMC1349 TaxID=2736254 RepID=UPI0020A62415|nr:hypothetical protein [Bacillus sp. WMMC1349]